MNAKNLFYTILLSSLTTGCFDKEKNEDVFKFSSNTSNASNTFQKDLENDLSNSENLNPNLNASSKSFKEDVKDLQSQTNENKKQTIEDNKAKQKLLSELSQLNNNLLNFLNSKPFKNTMEKLFIDGIDLNLEYHTYIVKGVKNSDELIPLLGKEHNFLFEDVLFKNNEKSQISQSVESVNSQNLKNVRDEINKDSQDLKALKDLKKSNSLSFFLPKDFYLSLIDLHKEVPLDKEKQIPFLKEVYSDKTDAELEDMVVKHKYYEYDLYLPKTKIKWLDFLLAKNILLNYKNEESDLLEFFENNNNLLKSLKGFKNFDVKDESIFFKIIEVVNKIEDFSQDDIDILHETIKSINLIKICFELENFKDDYEDTTSRAYSDHINFSGLNLKHKVMNFSLNKYIYLGGAHGNNYIEPINIDLVDKKIIQVEEVLNININTINEIQSLVYEIEYNFENVTKNSQTLKSKSESLRLFEEQKKAFENKMTDLSFSNEYRKYLSLRNLLQEKLKNYLKKIDGEYYDETQVPKIYDISFDFYINDEGLTFIYQPYHLLPFVYGHVFLNVTFEELQKYDLLMDKFKN